MPNINTTINNPNSVTIDISGITDEQRRLLKLCIDYQDDNPLPLIVALLADSMEQRKNQAWRILEAEKMQEARSEIEAVIGSM